VLLKLQSSSPNARVPSEGKEQASLTLSARWLNILLLGWLALRYGSHAHLSPSVIVPFPVLSVSFLRLMALSGGSLAVNLAPFNLSPALSC